MAKEFYTLIVVPHAKARFRRFQVSVRLMKWVGGVSTTVVVVTLGLLIHYSRIAVEVHELRRLRVENRTLLSKTQEYEQNAGKLRAKVDLLQGMVTTFRARFRKEASVP